MQFSQCVSRSETKIARMPTPARSWRRINAYWSRLDSMKRIAGLSLSLYLVFLGTRSFIGAPQHTSNGDINIAVHNGSVLLPVLIDGKRLSFLVDTGSTRSSISEALIKDLNLQYSGTAEVGGNYCRRICGKRVQRCPYPKER